jgi:hypothetical protein
MKESGGINIILGAVIGALVGFIVAGVVICIIDMPAYQRKKYAVAEGAQSEGGEQKPN